MASAHRCNIIGCKPSGPGDLSHFNLFSLVLTVAGSKLTGLCSSVVSHCSVVNTPLKNSLSTYAAFLSVLVNSELPFLNSWLTDTFTVLLLLM